MVPLSLIQLDFEEMELLNSAWPLSLGEHAERVVALDRMWEFDLEELHAPAVEPERGDLYDELGLNREDL